MGICEILTIIFVLCKLFGVISWSWWFVLLPEIIALAFYIVSIIVMLVLGRGVNLHIKRHWDD